MRNTKLTTLAALGGLLASMAAAQVDPNRVVAVVNGEEIKGAEYYHRMEYLEGIGKRTGNSVTELPPGLWALDQIITERLVLQLAKDKGAYPTDLEVTNEIKVRQAANPDLLKIWTSAGRTETEYTGRVRYELAQYKIQTAGITVTDQDVEKFYKENPAEFTTPKYYKLRVISVADQAGEAAVDADLKAGKKFEDVAKERSTDVTKQVGGELEPIPVDYMNNATKKAVEAAKLGGTTDWVQTGTAEDPVYVKFLIVDITAPVKQGLTPELRTQIRKRRAADLGAVKNNIQQEMAEMRRKAKIDIKQTEFAEAYKELIQAYLNQPSSGKGG
ncbi:peptidylprolyl isomerase PrsA [soil metagenome]